MRSSAAFTSLAPVRPRLPWTATFSVAPTSASRFLSSGSIESSSGFARSFSVRRESLEQLADLALVVRLAAAKRERRP